MSRYSLYLALVFVSTTYISAQDWPLDTIHLRNGHSFQGVILQETNDAVHFRQVLRRPGKPTYVLDAVFFRDEIGRIERIDDTLRQDWIRQLEKLDPRGLQEKRRREALQLERRPEGAWFYSGEWFALWCYLSSEELTRRVVVRLEDMFAALREYLGERFKPQQRLVIYLYKDSGSYQRALKERGLQLSNPAVYIPERAEILVVTTWEQLAEQLTRVRAQQEAQLRELERYEGKLRQHYHGQPPPEVLEKLKAVRAQLLRIGQENEAILDRQLQPLFRLCYHETFHAYLDLYLFPQAQHKVPRWLNEGLAQIIETAIVETGEIRIGHLDVERLQRVQRLLRENSMPTIHELLRSETRHFQVNHNSEGYASDRYFLASWATAYYFLFGPHSPSTNKTIASPPGQSLIRFIEQLTSSEDVSRALQDHTGKSLADLERDWQLYFLRLRPDGTLRPLEEVRPAEPTKAPGKS
ncbi:MAG: hypothetical protein RMJ19_00420 [Gemmatales bacterium]|nr:DUF1570 domain-containing protein [Gemmatales bacterium]MDW8174108.1 hypothetical protein [Gemmatales bacterium]